MPKRLIALGFAFRRFAVPGRVGARVFGLNIGCRYSTPVRKRPLHPTRSQFKPEASQTQAPVQEIVAEVPNRPDQPDLADGAETVIGWTVASSELLLD